MFVLTAALTFFALMARWGFLENWTQRLFYVLVVGAMYVYCGFGAAYETVTWTYRVFLAVLSLTFILALRGCRGLGQELVRRAGGPV